ncbi:hypothetical protein GCM10011410_24680 [Hoyosella rhizosphaerae]|uniref:Uncharacterized protein n=1 Tax=Hoyosella rhizosphaerae TaxID=1755582 RepID=A0A916UEZ4_9ACTN|nr:hypothetical protein GCM10011410_24680 [Hoyosella rhizosphaerae]
MKPLRALTSQCGHTFLRHTDMYAAHTGVRGFGQQVKVSLSAALAPARRNTDVCSPCRDGVLSDLG